MDASNFDDLAPHLRRVTDALLEGQAPATEDMNALSDSERRELAALARTANLTFLALHQPVPSEETEGRSLARAQATLAAVGPRSGVPQSLSSPPPPRSGPHWIDRLRRLLGVPTEEDEP